MNTLKELVEADLSTPLGNRSWNRRFSSVEYSGACPWCSGSNRFHVYPDANDIPGVGTLGYYLCMDSRSGGRSGCGRRGDGLHYLQEKRGLHFVDACKEMDIDPEKLMNYRRAQKGLPLSEKQVRQRTLPSAMGDTSREWQERADCIVALAQKRLAMCREALTYLQHRGLNEQAIKDAEIGYCLNYGADDAKQWGYEGGNMRFRRGIVIPWRDATGRVVCIRFRRLPSDQSDEARKYYGVDEKTGEINRYIALYGSATQHLYRGETLFPGCYTAVFEGELDALAARQDTDDSICIVATGSTSWARSATSEAKLGRSAKVLIAYNADQSGDKASKYWLSRIKNARRWRPLWSDANDMMLDGINVGEWLMLGFSAMDESAATKDEPFICSVCQTDLNNPKLDAFFDEYGIAYCGKDWHTKRTLDVIFPAFGPVHEVRVLRKSEYTLKEHMAYLQQKECADQKLRQLSSRKQRERIAS
jgi:DNA primase